MSTELATKSQSLAPVAEPSVALMLQTFIDKGVTAENVAALDALCQLKMKLDDRQAEKDFAIAFAALQSEMPAVKATKAVLNNDGSPRYTYAPFEEIVDTLRPLLTRHGFSITFSMPRAEDKVIAQCTLIHIGGHSRTNEFAVRTGRGAPGCNEAQADGSARSYAKRYALCDALNIPIDKDDDASAAGGETITQQQADELRDLCDETKAVRAKFLEAARVEKFEDIPVDRYDDLLGILMRRKSK